MAVQVAGATVLVTGASSGIGAALAPLLAARGATVGIVARRADRLAEVLDRCRDHAPASRLWVCDLADTDAAEALALEAWDAFGGLDVLVNNAALPKRRDVRSLTLDELRHTMTLNFESPVRMSQALVPRMIDRGRGSIVNVSSFGGRAGIIHEAAYCASKFALCGWSESMALDLWHTPVDVRLILPGAIATEIWDRPGSDAAPYAGPFEPPELVAEGIVAAIEGDRFEHYLPDMQPIVELKTSAIDDFMAGVIAYTESQRATVDVRFDPARQHLAARAETTPDKPAVVMHPSGVVRTYREIDEAASRLARVLHDRGLRRGDHLAVLLDNQPEFYDAVWAANLLGLYVTPINWHLTADEAGYIVADCDATALVATARLADVLGAMGDHLDRVTTRVSVDGPLPGFERYEDVVAGVSAGPVADECEGGWMFYSSGTTGRPKGILPPLVDSALGAPSMITWMQTGMFGMDDSCVYLSPAPLYHAAPAGWTVGVHRLGGTAVVMERFDPVEVLAAVERHRVTHVQLVPTHMVRLLKLPEAERRRYDVSSLQMVVHAAAPCPVEVKRRFMDWVGPIVHEFYSGSEGAGLCYIGPEEWLAHPGSVGTSMTGPIHIVGQDGEDLPVGEEGEVWFETNRHFEYHRDPEQSKTAWDRERGRAWLGDVGRLDEDGYLYLTDRASNMIISGGVNIYPREIEDVLVVHPAVDDVAVLGTPDPDMGEQVTAYVQLAPDATATTTADELIAYARERLSHFKCPKEVRFVDRLPRMPTGKLLKRLLPRD